MLSTRYSCPNVLQVMCSPYRTEKTVQLPLQFNVFRICDNILFFFVCLVLNKVIDLISLLYNGYRVFPVGKAAGA
jgi:hypothetical protein